MKHTIRQTILILLIIPMLSCSKKEEDTTPIQEDPIEEIEDPIEETLCDIIDSTIEGEVLNAATELPLVTQVYVNFEDYCREKDREAFRSIILYNSMPLFITGKEVSGIVSITLDGGEFENYIIDDPNPHELQISDQEFSIYNGAATSWATYHEVISGDTIGTGIDLFFYLNTSDGWKLTTTNNTYILSGDETDYEITAPMEEEPSLALSNMVSAFNSQDKTAFLDVFKSESGFYFLSGLIAEEFSTEVHTPEAFVDCAFAATNAYTLSTSDITIDVRDQFLAEVTTNYSLEQNGTTAKSGKLIMTMIGTPIGGWEISATALTF